jgi:2-C-methyl-D-erythritol 4-phosphate cytidylyltransferase
MKTYAIIPAGGSGKRIGSKTPKQYIKVKGKELIVHSLEIFQRSDLIDHIVIAAQPDYFDKLQEFKQKYQLTKILNVVEGGRDRQESVKNALFSIKAEKTDIIAVHDAARPLLPPSILNKALTEAKSSHSVVVAIPARDTLVKGNNKVVDYIDRTDIFYVQTPQIFNYEIILDAFEKAVEKGFKGTDESMLVKKAGYDVNIVNGSMLNFKVTSESDLELFNLIAQKS